MTKNKPIRWIEHVDTNTQKTTTNNTKNIYETSME
jgi:hypothetical protein